MTNTNLVLVTGNLTQDAELKNSGTDKAYFTFSVAVNRSFKKKDSDEWQTVTTFLNNMVVFGAKAERLAEKFKKGASVLIRGHLVMNDWEKDGQKHSELKVRPDAIEFLKFPKDSKANGDKDPVSDTEEAEIDLGSVNLEAASEEDDDWTIF